MGCVLHNGKHWIHFSGALFRSENRGFVPGCLGGKTVANDPVVFITVSLSINLDGLITGVKGREKTSGQVAA